MAAFGQEKPDVLPLPLVSPTALQPGTLPSPETAEEKFARAFRHTFSPRSLANRAALAGVDQFFDSPEEWPQGMEGYGMRFGSRMGRMAVRNFIVAGSDVALGLDQRYDRCTCTGTKSRSGHAIRRVFVARTDHGGEAFNVSRMLGAYGTPMLTDQWNPDRLNTWGHHFTSGTSYLGWEVGQNLLREFWPEIRQRIPFKRARR